MTLYAGDEVADDTGLPALEQLLKLKLGEVFAMPEDYDAADDFDPEAMMPGWESKLVLSASAHYAARGSVAGAEERWLMDTPSPFIYNLPADDPGTYRKRAYGLWRFLHFQRVIAQRERLKQSVDWANALKGLDAVTRGLVDSEASVGFGDLPALTAALKLMEHIIGRYAETRADLDRQRREVTGPEWPSAKYMITDAAVIEILEADIPEVIDADYFSDLTAAIAEAREKIRSIGRTIGPGYSGQPGQRHRPGGPGTAARQRRRG
jgi:hypothetical protein